MLNRAAAVLQFERVGQRRVEKHAVALDPRDDAVEADIHRPRLPGRIAARWIIHTDRGNPIGGARPFDTHWIADSQASRGIDAKACGTSWHDFIDHAAFRIARKRLRARSEHLDERALARTARMKHSLVGIATDAAQDDAARTDG